MTEPEARVALAREDVFRYIAACYYQPEPAFEDEGMFMSLLDAVSLIDESMMRYARKMGEEFSVAGTETLLLDYTRLFLGPTTIPAKPYGSVWLEGEKTVMGDSTMAVLELYREAGFDIDEDFRDLPDHIAVELEFLYLLIFRENEARMLGDASRLNSLIDLKKRFLSNHLGRWVVPFTSAILAFAECGFYRHLAELTRAFVERESLAAGCRIQGT